MCLTSTTSQPQVKEIVLDYVGETHQVSSKALRTKLRFS